MRVGCWDCGKKLGDKSLARPRTVKAGLKNTVEVCERCFALWHLKQYKKQQALFDDGLIVEIPTWLKWAGINTAIKFLEGLK